MSVEILPWHRRHAMMLANPLPDGTADAVIILRLATELAEGVLAGPDKSVPAKVLTIVRDPA